MNKDNPFVTIRLRKDEIEDIIGVYELIKWKNGSSSEDGKFATKIVKRLKKYIDNDNIGPRR